MPIREIGVEDAAGYLLLQKELEKESTFMLYDANERKNDVEKTKQYLVQVGLRPTSTILVLEEDQTLVGFVEVLGEEVKRIRHRAQIIIGIRKSHQGVGNGKKLLKEAIDWAQKHDIKRLEITVMAHNKKALWLYSTCGFTVEGTRRLALKVDEDYVNEFYMSMIL